MSEKNKTNRKVIHQKDEKFDNYVKVLQLMIENKGKSFSNSEIRESIYGDESKKTSIKSMFQKIIEFYVSTNILVKVGHIIDDNLNKVEVVIDWEDYDDERKIYEIDLNNKTYTIKLVDVKVRLYDKDIDGIDKDSGEYYDDYYVVDLHIPKSRDGIERLCETVSSMITSIPDVDIYTPTLKTVLESEIFGLQRILVSQTISKSILKNHNIQNQSNDELNGYPLDIITNIIQSQISVNVEFENNNNTIKLNNTKIKKISINENSFDIHFDNFISQNHTDINQILSIENHNEDGLREDIEKVKLLINELPINDKEKIVYVLESVGMVIDAFVF